MPQQQVISLHFIIQGRWFTERIQDFVFERNLRTAHQWLDKLKPIPKYKERKMLFNGEGQFFGHTLCDDKKCDQCKDLRKDGDFRFENKPDNAFKKKLAVHNEFLKQYFFEIDEDTSIKKAVVSNVIVCQATLEKMKEVRYQKFDYERLHNKRIGNDYLNALDKWEQALDSLYREYGIVRGEKYDIGSKDWITKNEVDSIIDIVKAQALYNDEMKELIRQCKNTGVFTAMATEKMYAVTTKSIENVELMEGLSEEMERKKPAKPTKELIKIGYFMVPKHLVEDYANMLNQSDTSMMIYKSKYGKLDPLVEFKRFQSRVELHKKIFKEMELPYHQDIDHHKKNLTKKEKESLDLQESLTEYIESGGK